MFSTELYRVRAINNRKMGRYVFLSKPTQPLQDPIDKAKLYRRGGVDVADGIPSHQTTIVTNPVSQGEPLHGR